MTKNNMIKLLYVSLQIYFFSGSIESAIGAFKNQNLKAVRQGVFYRLTPAAYLIPGQTTAFITDTDLKNFEQLYQKTLNYLQQQSIQPNDPQECEALYAARPYTFTFCRFIFKGYASYGNRYLKYQLAGTPYPATPAFFMVLAPEQQDPWNYFYLYLYDPQQLSGAKDDLAVIKNFKALRWGVYRQKPGATGTGKDGPVVLSHKMTEKENNSAVKYFTKKIYLKSVEIKRPDKKAYRFKIDNLSGYTVDLYSMSYDEQSGFGYLRVVISFAPVGGYPEFSYEFKLAVNSGRDKNFSIKSETFRINKEVWLNPQAVAYNNQLRKELQGGRSYQAPLP